MALLNRVILSTCSRIVAFLILRDLPSDWYTRSQPAATSHGEHSNKTDKIIMYVYEHIARQGDRIVAIDD